MLNIFNADFNVIIYSLLGLTTALLCSILLTPFVASFAEKFNIIDIPNSRKVHKNITPRLGGLSIFISFVISLFFLIDMSRFSTWYIIANLIIVGIGAIDDQQNLTPKVKLLFQSVAAFIIIKCGSVVFPMYTPDGNIPIYSYILTFIWIIGTTNAVNLSDGMDGLASSITAVSALTTAFLFFYSGNQYLALIALCFAGSIIGFLRYNLPNAKIFMGDIGSLFLGFNISVLIVLAIPPKLSIESLIYPALLIPLPIIDTLYAIIRRLKKGQNPFHADKGHIHHMLMKMKFNKNQILILFLIYSCLISFCITYSIVSDKPILTLFPIILTIILTLAIYTKNNDNFTKRVERFTARIRCINIHAYRVTYTKVHLIINTLIAGSVVLILCIVARLVFPINNIYLLTLITLYVITLLISLHFRSVFEIKNHFTTFMSFWIYFVVTQYLWQSELKNLFATIVIFTFILALIKIILIKKYNVFALTPMEIIFTFLCFMIIFTNNNNTLNVLLQMLLTLFIYYSNKIFFIINENKYRKYIYINSSFILLITLSSFIFLYGFSDKIHAFNEANFKTYAENIDNEIKQINYSQAISIIEEVYEKKPVGYDSAVLSTKATRAYPYLFLDKLFTKQDEEAAINVLIRFIDRFPLSSENFFIIIEPVLRSANHENIKNSPFKFDKKTEIMLNSIIKELYKIQKSYSDKLMYTHQDKIQDAIQLLNSLML